MNLKLATHMAPVALFCYNRLDCLRLTIEALKQNSFAEDTSLIVFADGAKNDADQKAVQEVRSYIHGISGFSSVEIHEAKFNSGLANSVIAGVSEVVNYYGKVIVVEDDLVTSPDFLTWMNVALERFADEDSVGAVCGFSPLFGDALLPESFFLKSSHCWGWGTWKRAWSQFNPDARALVKRFTRRRQIREFNMDDGYFFYEMLKQSRDGIVDSWFQRWNASLFFAGKYTLYPKYNLISNVGVDSGTHYSSDSEVEIIPLSKEKPGFAVNSPIEENLYARKLYRNYYLSLWNPPTWYSTTKSAIRLFLLYCCPYGILKLYGRYCLNMDLRIAKKCRDDRHAKK